MAKAKKKTVELSVEQAELFEKFMEAEAAKELRAKARKAREIREAKHADDAPDHEDDGLSIWKRCKPLHFVKVFHPENGAVVGIASAVTEDVYIRGDQKGEPTGTHSVTVLTMKPLEILEDDNTLSRLTEYVFDKSQLVDVGPALKAPARF